MNIEALHDHETRLATLEAMIGSLQVPSPAAGREVQERLDRLERQVRDLPPLPDVGHLVRQALQEALPEVKQFLMVATAEGAGDALKAVRKENKQRIEATVASVADDVRVAKSIATEQIQTAEAFLRGLVISFVRG